MKHLKMYENSNVFGDWTYDRLKKNDDERDYIKHCLYDFLKFKNEDIIYIQDFKILRNNRIQVDYQPSKSQGTWYRITGDEYSDFILFLNDPDTYKDTKKFNI